MIRLKLSVDRSTAPVPQQQPTVPQKDFNGPATDLQHFFTHCCKISNGLCNKSRLLVARLATVKPTAFINYHCDN